MKLLSCPQCQSHSVRQAHLRMPLDAILRLFFIRPYRCRHCNQRFYSIKRAVAEKA